MPYRDPERGRLYRAAWYQKNKAHHMAKVKLWRAAHPKKRRAYARRYYHSTKGKAAHKARYAALWERFIKAYGGRCQCCEESNRGFLTIEHIGGGGLKHRKMVGGTVSVLMDIERRGYPSEFTVLCYNCNMGSARNKGICPHKT